MNGTLPHLVHDTLENKALILSVCKFINTVYVICTVYAVRKLMQPGAIISAQSKQWMTMDWKTEVRFLHSNGYQCISFSGSKVSGTWRWSLIHPGPMLRLSGGFTSTPVYTVME
jgi:hypothetical protein